MQRDSDLVACQSTSRLEGRARQLVRMTLSSLDRFDDASLDTISECPSEKALELAKTACKSIYRFDVDTISVVSNSNYRLCFNTPYHTNSSPSLLVMKSTFGSTFLQEWMEMNVAIMSEMVGNTEKLSPFQISAISARLINKFTGEVSPMDRLNAAEVLLFFSKCIGGDFGRFYGRAVDIVTIGQWAEMFLEWRSGEIEKASADQENERRIEEKNKMEREYVRPTPEQEAMLHCLYEAFKVKETATSVSQSEVDEHNRQFLELIKNKKDGTQD